MPDTTPPLPSGGRTSGFQCCERCEQEIWSWRRALDPGGCQPGQVGQLSSRRACSLQSHLHTHSHCTQTQGGISGRIVQTAAAPQSLAVCLLEHQVCFPTFCSRVSKGTERWESKEGRARPLPVGSVGHIHLLGPSAERGREQAFGPSPLDQASSRSSFLFPTEFWLANT